MEFHSKLYADGMGPSYDYTPEGRLSRRTWARGVVTEYAYDAWGNLTNTVYSDGTPTVSLCYDAMGRQIEAHDAAGTTTFAYDAFGSLTNETVIGIAGTNAIVRFWDGFGRSAGYSLNGERQTTIGYDSANGRIASMLAAGADVPFEWSYLQGSDLKASLAYPNGLTASWQYDANNQLLQVCNATPTNVISQYDYTYDAAGRRISCSHSGSAFEVDDIISYGCNIRSELTNAVAAVDSNYRYFYQYDDIGNRLWSLENTNRTEYVANCLNQYTVISNFLGASSIPELFSPQYDDDGNQTLIQTETGIWSVTYNGENRPVLWSNGETNIVMDYDRKGRRIIKNSQRFTYDGYLQIADNEGNAYAWDPTELVATRPLCWMLNELLMYYLHDGDKNTTDVYGHIHSHHNYGTFGAKYGNMSFNKPFSISGFQFSSEYFDAEIESAYYNFRHLNPRIGRWVSRDFEGYDYIMYLAVRNNPYLRYDWLGLEIHWIRHTPGDAPPNGWGGENWNGQTQISNAPNLDGLTEYQCAECKIGYRGTLEDMEVHSYFRYADDFIVNQERQHFDCYAAYYAQYWSIFIKATLICDERGSAERQLQELKSALNIAIAYCNMCNDKLDRPGGPHGH